MSNINSTYGKFLVRKDSKVKPRSGLMGESTHVPPSISPVTVQSPRVISPPPIPVPSFGMTSNSGLPRPPQ